MSAYQMKNLHVPLPEHIHGRLLLQARRTGLTATALAREAIQHWLVMMEEEALDQEIGQYADAVAGTSADLDCELEVAASELLLAKGSKREDDPLAEKEKGP